MTAENPITKLTLVERQGQEVFTNSLVVAEQCALTHATVLKNIRKYKSDFEEFGQLGFETRVVSAHGAGQKTEIAILNEDQATYLITLSRNTPQVRKFKIALVKAFRKALNEIGRLYANPPRQDILQGKRKANKPMLDALIECRSELGKDTATHHYTNEARLCNGVVTGKYAAIDEKSLSNDDAELLKLVRKRNEAHLVSGLDYQARKGKLIAFATRHRTNQVAIISTTASC